MAIGLLAAAILLAQAAPQTQAAGMPAPPLQVDDLAPGTVTVRVIRRTFSENIAGHPVDLQVLAAEGIELQEMTDEAGRATFTNLPIGATVLVRTLVDDERLTSEQFRVPAQGGMRLALVAGVGAGSGVNAPAAPRAPAAAAPADSAPLTATVILAALTVCVAAFFGWSILRRRRR